MEPTAMDAVKKLTKNFLKRSAKNFLEKLADEPKTKLQPKKEIQPTTMDVLKKSTKNFLRKSANKLKEFQPKTKEELQKLVGDRFRNLGDIDTSLITDMSYLFSNANRTDFSGIENWDVSSVNDMSGMFAGAKKFNQPLDNWDVSSMYETNGMFECSAQDPLPKWYNNW